MKHKRGLAAGRFFQMQLAVVVISAALLCVYFGVKTGVSVLLGGGVAILPNVYFAKKLFQHRGAQAAKKIVRGFYQGEAMKLLLTMTLFCVVFKTVKVAYFAFFVGFILVQFLNGLAPFFFQDRFVKK